MLHIIERTHKIKGLKEPKDIVALADMHLTYIDDREDEYSQGLKKERSYMFPNGDRCFNEIREYVKKTQPDVVVSVGDFIDFPSHANLEVMDDFFNNDCKEHIAVLGNHDWNYPRNYNCVYNWRDNVPKFNCVLHDGNPYVQVVDLGGVLVVGLDNNTDRFFPETVEQFKKVAALGKPMILAMHVPFYTPTGAPSIQPIDHQKRLLMAGVPQERKEDVGNCQSCLANDATNEFLRMMYDENVNVVASLSGHLHFEYFPHDYLFEDRYTEGRIQYGLRISAPQLTNEGVVFRMHLIPDND